MISREEGRSWQDEVCYLDGSAMPGSYNASVVLNDDLILIVVCSTCPGQEPAEVMAIRWRQVKS